MRWMAILPIVALPLVVGAVGSSAPTIGQRISGSGSIMSVTEADGLGCGGVCHCTPITIAPKVGALP
jgi:hypothetical protein